RSCVFFSMRCFMFFLNDTAPIQIYTLSLHDALPICADPEQALLLRRLANDRDARELLHAVVPRKRVLIGNLPEDRHLVALDTGGDRKSTRLNSVTVASRMPSSA